MRNGMAAAGAVLLVLSISCIAWTTMRMIAGSATMGSPKLWAAVLFHGATAVAAMAFLDAARGGRR